MVTKASSVLAIALLLAELAGAQEPKSKPEDQDQPIRLRSELVELRAVVTDREGEIVDNLKMTDFEVLENGKPQQISLFSIERVRSSPGAQPSGKIAGPTPISPNARPLRTIVLFVDTLHLEFSSMVRVREALRRSKISSQVRSHRDHAQVGWQTGGQLR